MESGVPAWLVRVARSIRRRRRAGLGPRWVVAVSGGSDSVAMLRALHAIAGGSGLALTVAHLDHGARPESGEDGRFVEGLAESLGLPFDLGHWRPTRSAHFEADARTARYAWLAEVAQRRGADVVAVGQTRDDQAETVLHRLLRGTGPRGLAGIPKARKLAEGITLFRPLLDVDRARLRAYLASIGQPWRDDPTNADTSRTRARIRHELLPALAADYNPAVVAALVRLGSLTRAAIGALDERVAALVATIVVEGGPGAVAFDRAGLVGCPAYLRAEILRSAWRDAGWPEAAMDARRWGRLTRQVVGDEGTADIGAGVRLIVRPSRVELTRRVGTAAPEVPTAPPPRPSPSRGEGALEAAPPVAFPPPLRGRAGWGVGADRASVPDPSGAPPPQRSPSEEEGVRGRSVTGTDPDSTRESEGGAAILEVPGTAVGGGVRVVASLEFLPDAERLDRDRLVPPLVIDRARPGDRFDPLGLGGHSMPLADFFRGRRVPRAERPGVAVVRDAVGIVWVVGHRIGHRARITEATTRVVWLHREGEGGEPGRH